MFAPPPGSTASGVWLSARPWTTSLTVPSPPSTTTRSTPSCAAPRATCVACPARFVSTFSRRASRGERARDHVVGVRRDGVGVRVRDQQDPAHGAPGYVRCAREPCARGSASIAPAMGRRRWFGRGALDAVPELRHAGGAFGATLAVVEGAKASLVSAVRSGRSPGAPLAEALAGFELGLADASASMDAWRVPEVEETWTACPGLDEARARAEALRRATGRPDLRGAGRHARGADGSARAVRGRGRTVPRAGRQDLNSGLDRHLVDLVGRVTGPIVDPLHGLGVRRLGQAEDLPGHRIRPCLLEVDSPSPWIARSASWASMSPSGVIPTIPSWTSMNSGIVLLLSGVAAGRWI